MRRTTIADIAGKLHVSLHSVNKALSGKKGIGEELRRRILRTAEEMNYRVNRVAQSMARKPFTIGVVHHASFWMVLTGPFLDGIRSAVARLQDYNVDARYYAYEGTGRDDALRRAVADGVDAVICMGFVPLPEDVELLTGRGILFALLGTDGAEQRRLTSVRTDSLMSGRLAGELLALALPPSAPVAVFTGFCDYRDHADKIAGFAAEVAARGLRLVGVYEHRDQPELAASVAGEVLRLHPEIAGVYASTGNCVTLCRALIREGDRPAIVGTDLYPEIKELIREGFIMASLYQNAPDQGARIVELLYAAGCEKKSVPERVQLPPTPVFGANLDAF